VCGGTYEFDKGVEHYGLVLPFRAVAVKDVLVFFTYINGTDESVVSDRFLIEAEV
jgi:hypothetical protein